MEADTVNNDSFKEDVGLEEISDSLSASSALKELSTGGSSKLPSVEELSRMTPEELEDLFNKNTASFRCLAQVLISRSSLLRSALYWFPELEDPGIDKAFEHEEPEPVYTDGVGLEKYLALCKDMNIVPITIVKKSLARDKLNLKYYGLTEKQMKAICEALILNHFVRELNLQDNWLTPEMALQLGEVLIQNHYISHLNLRECRIGPLGAENLNAGIDTTECLRELDLSYNSLGDAGFKALAPGLRDNVSIKKLNLSHNEITDDSGKIMGRIIRENIAIEDLDLSWNDLLTEKAMKVICENLLINDNIRILNLSWNGTATKDNIYPLLKYLKEGVVLEELNLRNNQILGTISFYQLTSTGSGSLEEPAS